MNITKKIDRAFQRVGEKMGGGAQTSMSDDFKMLEIETNLRHDGMERLQKSTNVYVKSISRRCDGSEDKEKGLPVSLLGRTFVSHGEDFGPDSEFGNCLIALGRANDRMGSFQESFATDAATLWLDSIERNLAMMKDYQTARKKLENRRLTYDSTMSKMQKARRDDIRIEEELRTNKAKYEESSEDVMQRMQDIQETEAESLQDLTGFLEAELEYHERCAEELRKVRQNWAMSMDGYTKPQYNGYATPERKLTTRSRSNTARSWTNPLSRTSSNTNVYNDPEPEPVRIAIRSSSRQSNYAPEIPTRPAMGRANTYAPGAPADRGRANSGASTPVYSQNVTALRAGLRPVSTNMPSTAGTPRNHHGGGGGDVFADDGGEDTASGSGSPEWGERSASPATSYGSLSRSSTNNLLPPSGGGGGGGVRKPPPPPPPSRAKKPAPPVPARRDLGY